MAEYEVVREVQNLSVSFEHMVHRIQKLMATVRSEEILKESSQQAAAMMKKAETTIEQERKKAMNELKDEVASLSVMIASKVVERDVKEADHERFIEEFIDKVG